MDIIKQIINYKTPAYNWQERMRKTPQSPKYHGEGDVFTHTIKVVESLLSDDEYNSLDENDKRLLLYAAILHDIAKPFCTKIEHGMISSPNHAVKGGIEVRWMLYRYGFMADLLGDLTFFERETVCALVRYHGLPLFFMNKRHLERDIYKASLEVNLYHLSILAKADVNGRISNDHEGLMERIRLFRETCEEFGCLHKPKEFISRKSMVKYFSRSEQYLYYEPYANRPKVYLMSGLPASGKDTYIKENLSHMDLVSLDGIRERLKVSPIENQGKVVNEAKAMGKQFMAKDKEFVWNATNLTLTMRASLIDLFRQYDYEVSIIYCEVPFNLLLERNERRERPVTEQAIDRMVKTLDVPKTWEAEEIIYHVEGNREG